MCEVCGSTEMLEKKNKIMYDWHECMDKELQKFD